MKVLFIGESWVIHMIHSKGFDSFTSTKYEEGATYLLDCLRKEGVELTYMPAHEVQVRFPQTQAELDQYDAVVISDIGANSFLLQNPTFYEMKMLANPLDMIKTFVAGGGGLLMIGGYLSFMGIEGKANYKNSPLAEVLPVTMMDGDDRAELPQGFSPEVTASHPIVDGLGEWPRFLGYNRIKAKPDAAEIMKHGEDSFLVTGTYGKGRTAAFASDCAPHWGSKEFVDWNQYSTFWGRLVHSLKG